MKIQSKGPISCQFLLRAHEYFLAYSAKYHAVSITRAISPLKVASSNKLIYCTGCVPRFWWPSSLLSLWMFIWYISQRPHCAGLISERSFISKVQAQASTLIRHENGAFWKRVLQTGGIWIQRLFVFVWTENIFKTELFEKDDVTIITWFPWPSENHKSKMAGDCQSETSVFKFLQRKRGLDITNCAVSNKYTSQLLLITKAKLVFIPENKRNVYRLFF